MLRSSSRLLLLRSNPQRLVHSSPMLLKMAEKKPDKALRIHLFDFDAVETVKVPQDMQVLPESELAPVTPGGHRPPAATRIDVPFTVHRSKNNELPVYTEFKNKKARQSTVIRRISGDVDAFQAELRKLVGPKPVIKQRVASIEVFANGDATTLLLKDYLLRLGF
jgi:hypothetical protein